MSKAKIIEYDEDARNSMRAGLQSLAKAVKTTLGPRGRNVIIEKSFGSPIVTKDGVTVAKEVELENPMENIGAQLVKEVAAKTNEDAGDGTTTATVLAEAIYEEGVRSVAAGANGLHLKRGIDKAAAALVLALKELATPVKKTDEIKQVAKIASNGDEEIGTTIAEAMDKVGKDGTITVEEGRGALETTVSFTEGMEFDRGYIAAHFSDPVTNECILENPLILISNRKINNLKECIPLLEGCATAKRPLLIIAEDVEGEALGTLILNHVNGNLQSCAVKAPGFGDRRRDLLGDIGALVGAEVFYGDTGQALSAWTVDRLGSASKVLIGRNHTTIIEGGGTEADVETRIESIRVALENSTDDFTTEKCKERLAKMSGGVAQLKVGATTEAEMKEKKARVEDALHATRAAAQEGIVPGGGVALIRVAGVIDTLGLEGEEKLGAEIVKIAIRRPLWQISTNAGEKGDVVVDKVMSGEGDFGFNAYTREYGNLLEMGVVDPAKVVRCALQNAAGVAGLLLTTDAVIYKKPATKDNSGGGMNPMGMPPGMMG